MLMPTKLLFGIAAVALAGSAAIASTLPVVHHLSVRLPGGGVEQISYTGNTAPKLLILPVVFSTQMLTPTNFEAQFSDLNRTIAEINQMKSIVDRQMAAAMGGREALPLTGPFELADPALGSIPVSAESYFFVSTLNGNGVCTREVQMTNLGDSLKPTVISQRSGNCSGRSATDIPPHDIAQLQKAGTRLPVEIMPPGKHV